MSPSEIAVVRLFFFWGGKVISLLHGARYSNKTHQSCIYYGSRCDTSVTLSFDIAIVLDFAENKWQWTNSLLYCTYSSIYLGQLTMSTPGHVNKETCPIEILQVGGLGEQSLFIVAYSLGGREQWSWQRRMS